MSSNLQISCGESDTKGAKTYHTYAKESENRETFFKTNPMCGKTAGRGRPVFHPLPRICRGKSSQQVAPISHGLRRNGTSEYCCFESHPDALRAWRIAPWPYICWASRRSRRGQSSAHPASTPPLSSEYPNRTGSRLLRSTCGAVASLMLSRRRARRPP